MSAHDMDALELEVFRHAVESVVDELDINITRTAYSPIVYEYKDYVVGTVTRDFRLLSQSKHCIPIFVADLGEAIADAVGVIGVEHIRAGDVFLTNYGPASGSHLNHVVVATPVHLGGEIAGYVAIRSHWSDVGGARPTISWSARHIFEEGVQYRGLKVVAEGRLVPEVVATIEANSWQPELVIGDLMANIAACTMGARRWEEGVAAKWGRAEFDALVEAQFAASERLARARIAEIPDGEYAATCDLDDSGSDGTPPLTLAVRVRVSGSDMVVDLSDMPPQVAAPINSGAGGGAGNSIRAAFKSLVAAARPADHGLFVPLRLDVPPGRVMSADPEAPKGHWNQLPPTMMDLFLRAIGSREPRFVPAGHFGNNVAANVSGTRPDGTYWKLVAGSTPGGFGASEHADGYGPLGMFMLGDNPQPPLELMEGRYPIRYEAYRILREHGGRGRHRGGPGVEKVFSIVEPALLSARVNRTREPAWGLAGGESGRPSEIQYRLPGEDWRRVQVRLDNLPVPAGTEVRVRSGGGGGWGTPEG